MLLRILETASAPAPITAMATPITAITEAPFTAASSVDDIEDDSVMHNLPDVEDDDSICGQHSVEPMEHLEVEEEEEEEEVDEEECDVNRLITVATIETVNIDDRIEQDYIAKGIILCPVNTGVTGAHHHHEYGKDTSCFVCRWFYAHRTSMIRAKQKQKESLANDRHSKELINSSIEEQVTDSIKNDNWTFTTTNTYYSDSDNDSDTEYTENRPNPRPRSAKRQASSNVNRRRIIKSTIPRTKKKLSLKELAAIQLQKAAYEEFRKKEPICPAGETPDLKPQVRLYLDTVGRPLYDRGSEEKDVVTKNGVWPKANEFTKNKIGKKFPTNETVDIFHKYSRSKCPSLRDNWDSMYKNGFLFDPDEKRHKEKKILHSLLYAKATNGTSDEIVVPHFKILANRMSDPDDELYNINIRSLLNPYFVATIMLRCSMVAKRS